MKKLLKKEFFFSFMCVARTLLVNQSAIDPAQVKFKLDLLHVLKRERYMHKT
jgi:hypothetical protein